MQLITKEKVLQLIGVMALYCPRESDFFRFRQETGEVLDHYYFREDSEHFQKIQDNLRALGFVMGGFACNDLPGRSVLEQMEATIKVLRAYGISEGW